MDPWGQLMSTRADLLSATGQFCWPPVGSYLSATGQFLMAADKTTIATFSKVLQWKADRNRLRVRSLTQHLSCKHLLSERRNVRQGPVARCSQ